MELIYYIIAGGAVGFAVGATGVGGGSLMTPLLLLMGFPLSTAIGTDLLYAAITKSAGAISHARSGHVQWRLVTLLALGSLPATLLTVVALQWLFAGEQTTLLLSSALGVMLIATSAVVLLGRTFLQRFIPANTPAVVTSGLGLVVGVMVTLSSVGAGALTAALLLALYPTLRAREVVGTDIAHAVPLTLVAGLGHLYLGHVDFFLLAGLLLGSLPMIHLGARFTGFLPERWLRSFLATVLLGAGVKLAFF